MSWKQQGQHWTEELLPKVVWIRQLQRAGNFKCAQRKKHHVELPSVE